YRRWLQASAHGRAVSSPPRAEGREMDFFNTLVVVLDSTVRLSIPLLFACLAGLYSERAGVFDIGLEGKMLAGAFAAASAAAVTGSAWYGLGAGILVSGF